MKILVCISHVPLSPQKINFTNGDSEFDTNGVQYVINPNDEFGLTRAIWFQEQQGATVTVANVGPGAIKKSISNWRKRSHSCQRKSNRWFFLLRHNLLK
jgi:electron transfer flavoprotein alpha/beta subunit